jgi:hypothetical protein
VKLADKRAADKAAHLTRERKSKQREVVEVTVSDEITAASDQARDEGES